VAKRIASLEDLKRVRDQARPAIEVRTGMKDIKITVHMGTCGIAAGAREVLTALASELEQAAVENVTLRQSGCLGLCSEEPMLTLADRSGREFRYGTLDASKVRRIVREHVIAGNPVVDCLITEK